LSGLSHTITPTSGQNQFAEADFYFAVIFSSWTQKWQSVLKIDTHCLKPDFRLKKLRILRV